MLKNKDIKYQYNNNPDYMSTLVFSYAMRI